MYPLGGLWPDNPACGGARLAVHMPNIAEQVNRKVGLSAVSVPTGAISAPTGAAKPDGKRREAVVLAAFELQGRSASWQVLTALIWVQGFRPTIAFASRSLAAIAPA